MRRVRRTTITVETHEVWSIALASKYAGKTSEYFRVNCAECNAQMITAEDAATIAGTCMRTVYRSIEAGMIHYVETSAGTVLVCLASLIGLHDVKAILPLHGDNQSDEPEQ